MAKNELLKLQSQLRSAKEKMDNTFEAFQDARKDVTTAYEVMTEKENRYVLAEKRVIHEQDLYQREERRYNEKWEVYNYVRDTKEPRIKALTLEAEKAHKEMCDNYTEATNKKNTSSMTSRSLLELGKIAELRYDALQREIRNLKEEIRDMLVWARAVAPKVDTSMYDRAKKLYDLAGKELEAATAAYEAAKYEREKTKTAYEAAKEEFERIKSELDSLEAG